MRHFLFPVDLEPPPQATTSARRGARHREAEPGLRRVEPCVPERGRPAVPALRVYRTWFAMTTNITEEHRRVFEALTSAPPGRYCLFSCFCNGEPAAAIAAVTVCPPHDDGGQAEYAISPLFVSLTPTMTLTDHDVREA